MKTPLHNQHAINSIRKEASLSDDEYRTALGAYAEELSDEEIKKIQHVHEQIAEIFIELWIKDRTSIKS